MAKVEHMDFLEYLAQVASIAKVQDRLQSYKSVQVVVGNDACDLDSAVCALVYAFHLHQTKTADTLILPVLNTPRADYSLKTEVKFALDEQAITSERHLTFGDNVDWNSLNSKTGKTQNGKLSIVLVDHHIPVGFFAGLSRCVREVVDHHIVNCDDERTEYLKKIPVRIVRVGSCSTLVGELVLDSTVSTNNSPHIFLAKIPPYLMYSAIILDTSNFSPEVGKATEKDSTIADRLEELSPAPRKSRLDIFTGLKNAKIDLTGMSIGQILRKDAKVAEVGRIRVLVASVPQLNRKVFDFAGDFQELQKACQERSFSAMVVKGSTFVDDKLEKDLLIYCPEKTLLEAICRGLESSSTPNLQLASTSLSCTLAPNEETSYRMYKQGNVKVSRKQILPLINDIIRKFVGANNSPAEIPSTATPPNTYVEQGYLGNADSLSEKLHRRVAEAAAKNQREPSGLKGGFDYDARNKTDPSTPSNTYIEESGQMMKTPQKHQVADLLRLKMAELDALSPEHRSRQQSNDFGNSAENEIFDME